jgi:hypothetical protein
VYLLQNLVTTGVNTVEVELSVSNAAITAGLDISSSDHINALVVYN